MDIINGYSGGITDNLDNKLGFLCKNQPEIADLIRDTPLKTERKSKRRSSIQNDFPSWLRVRPSRKKKVSGYSNSDDDYMPSENEITTYEDSDNEELFSTERRLGFTKRPNQYGAVEGVVIGQWWRTRIECSHAGAHRPTVAGIHGGPEGAYSVALSGGYEGDWDEGNEFTFTGEGGRDLKGTKTNPKNLRTAPQSKDQVLTRGNLALHMNVSNGIPVRVIRGYKLKSVYAPEDGYRYDGLYKVIKSWDCIGASGFLIYKFHFVRCEEQMPLIDSVDDMLLYTSIKKLLSQKEIQKRTHKTVRQKEYESSDEDSEGSTNSVKEEKKKNMFYVEGSDSSNMFHKGRFLGWNSAETYEESAKNFQKIVCMLEDSVDVMDFRENGNGVETSFDDGDSTLLLDNSSPDPEVTGHRRKRQVARRLTQM